MCLKHPRECIDDQPSKCYQAIDVLKGVKSNKSSFERPSVNRLYARILFPKIVENKESPHSYKKEYLLPSMVSHPMSWNTAFSVNPLFACSPPF